MKPLELRLKGMYSYQEEVHIDFERLIGGRLFGIFGPVGSGKSTILEAITYALYGRSERLDRSGQNYNLMNLRSSELYIEYIFALRGVRYRFTVSGRRNSKNFQDVRTFSRSAYEEKEGEWVPLESVDGAEVLGLSYENFTKTIIIPQGKFQEFLHLTPGERTKMLKELFDLERFDLLRPTNALLSETNQKVTTLEGRLEELPEVDTAGFEKQKKELEQREQERARIGKELKEMREQEEEMRRVKDLQDEMGEVLEMLASQQEDEQEFIRRRAQLERYQETQQAFGELMRRQKTLAENERKAERDLQRYENAAVELDKKLSSAEQQFQITRKAYDHRDEWKEKAEEMRRIVEIQRADQASQVLDQRMENGKAAVDQKAEEVKAQRGRENELGKELSERKAAMPDRARLVEYRNWIRERARLEKARESAVAATARMLEQAAELKREGEERLAPLEGALPETLLPDREQALAARRETLSQLRVHLRLADFAGELSSGEPCPLCGALEHPAPYNAGESDQRVREVEAEIAALEKEIQDLRDLAIELKAHDRRMLEMKERVDRHQEAENLAVDQVQAHKRSHTWPDLKDLAGEEIDAKIEAAKAEQEAVGKLERQREQLVAELRTAERELERYREGIAKLEQEKAGNSARMETLLGQLQRFDYAAHRDKRAVELEAKADFFAEEYEKVTRRFQEEDAKLSEMRDRRQKLTTDIRVERTQMESYAQDREAIGQTITIRLQEHGFATSQEVVEMLARELDVKQERDLLDGFFTELAKHRSDLEGIREKLGERSYDIQAHEALKQGMGEREEKEAELNQSIGELRRELSQMDEQIHKRAALEREKKVLQARAEKLGVLSYMFRGSGFVNFVSTMYLRELCLRANARFQKLTRNRLSLEVREDNTFVVRDMVNGGQVRGVKTLSGGQTFQASLSLALALSDNIQHRHDSQHNLFFLDEGFGTLDRDSLEIVFETLNELRRENRIVGIISHVEGLQEAIDLSLRVRQDEERGSWVKGSWA